MKTSQSGFALVQVMLGLAAAGALTYYVITEGDLFSKRQIKASFDQSLESQIYNIRTELGNYLNCTASFKGKLLGTKENPTVLSDNEGIWKGDLNTFVTPFEVRKKGAIPFIKIKERFSTGIYIKSMSLLTRPEILFDQVLDRYVEKEMHDVLRVEFEGGDLSSLRQITRTRDGLGATNSSVDFKITTLKDPVTKKITACYADSNEGVRRICEDSDGGRWDADEMACKFDEAIPKSDLIEVWTLADGGVGTIKPPPEKVKVHCICDEKQCSRARKPCTCALPACENSNWQYGEKRWTYTRNEKKLLNPIDDECVYAAFCEFNPQPAGWIVKPEGNTIISNPTTTPPVVDPTLPIERPLNPKENL
jgi:hypothetical protein